MSVRSHVKFLPSIIPDSFGLDKRLLRFLNNDWRQKPPPNGRLDWPKESDGIQLQITTNNYICDDEGKIEPWEGIQLHNDHPPPRPGSIPITFGRFDVQDADAIDVFNALADTKSEEKWDELLMNGPGVTYLGDFAKEKARGASVSFVARPFPDRQVFQWMVYNSTPNYDDMWVVYSTRRNDVLHHRGVENEGWPAVQAQNCLGAYHVVGLPQGGCHVVFSTMVNSYPPWPITAQFVFNIAWTKTADYIEHIRLRAQLLKKRRLESGNKYELVVPRWLVFDDLKPNKSESGDNFVADSKKVIPPFQGPDYIADIIQTDLLKDLKRLASSSHTSFGVLLLVVPGTAVLGLALWAWKALMVMGFQGHSGAQWASCCPWLFKAPVLAVPDHSPKEARNDDRTPEVPEFFLEGMETPKPETDSRDLIHAFQEETQIFAPAAPMPLPVLVVTGFLGSGKTTMVKQLMKRRSNLRVAAVAHDLAATINVDAAFLSSVADVQRGLGKGESLFQQTMTAFRDGDVAALSGCVCCPGFDDALSFAVRSALTQGADTGLLDYLVVETSGAADPRRIVGALEVRFGPLARVRLDRVATVVDAERVVAEGQRWELAQATEQQTAEEQLQLVQLSVADLVLLNKALDLAEVGPEDVLVDAGCGDGQVCLAAARRGARAVGWDLDENLVQECRRKARAQGYETLCSFERRDALGCQSQSRGPSLYQSEPKGPGRWLPHGTTVLFLFATDEVLEDEVKFLESLSKMPRFRNKPASGVERSGFTPCQEVCLSIEAKSKRVDLIKDEDVVWAKQLLQRLCPDAKVLPCRHGDVPVPDLLDVEVAEAVPTAAISHEDNPTCWKMSSSSTESSRPSHDRGFKGVDMNIHHRVAEWSTRDRGSKPVRLARLQHLLCEKLPRLRRWLRRGKGLLRVAEDPSARWDWELSGQLRYNLRRSGGTVPWSTLAPCMHWLAG
ncbi:COBW domain-containing protein DDB_G0274527 [Durusdinium trenchii]|uniref:COBW domain-containing protein DDB_G0274527 n=1 Tax=Durusdinium trenchii TaxID=1381693 RepID=A0ABP0K043_9DINO